MASGILGIGVTGLNAAQAGIRTTEHNISNVNTAGYRRQEVDFSALRPSYAGSSGWIGNGVTLDSVRQRYSQFLDNEVLLDQSRLSRYESYSAYASQVDGLLGKTDSSLMKPLNAFFDAANEVANDPVSGSARQVMLSAGKSLAGRVNLLEQSLRQLRDDSNREVENLTTRINNFAGKIAVVNESITRIEVGSNQPANDLRDQRDQLVGELNKLVNTTTIRDSDGSYNVFIGGGQALVMGNRNYTLSAVTDPNNSDLKVPALNFGSTTLALDTSLLTGGELGGVLAQRADVLMPAMDGLNRIAVAIGAEVNRVHRGGLQADAATVGGDFFSSVVQQTDAGPSSRVDVGFTGNPLANENYSVVYNNATSDYTVTRLSDASAVTVAAGVEVSLAGVAQGFNIAAGTPAPAAGATWQLNFKNYARGMSMQLTSGDQIAAASATAANPGPGDNSNALALAALRVDSTVLNNGTMATAYNNLVGNTAAYTSEAELSRSAYETLTRQAMDAQQAVSGVNLDEEAVNLIRYQQAYQAAARAISVANSLFDEVLALGR
ncbi:MAG: flagellar hook-associated protein FlgK [Pseudomonadota bacterium]|nr:flagellar hook-associated protein FlgK [Pseudomonadota bacterium]MDP1905428.1 flagellar hook-associated protein FlgK [Pseudomonadota bacterium]MDP2352902.1 flagellar hook-associated protein FlgK [Pseudomonadota bacterium]